MEFSNIFVSRAPCVFTLTMFHRIFHLAFVDWAIGAKSGLNFIQVGVWLTNSILRIRWGIHLWNFPWTCHQFLVWGPHPRFVYYLANLRCKLFHHCSSLFRIHRWCLYQICLDTCLHSGTLTSLLHVSYFSSSIQCKQPHLYFWRFQSLNVFHWQNTLRIYFHWPMLAPPNRTSNPSSIPHCKCYHLS